jgi:ankyrin repeat protein
MIERGEVDPLKMIIDHNSGAMLPHYAAHEGNLKFLRYLVQHFMQNPASGGSGATHANAYDFRDFYDCTIAHYAVRSGHLPILMYAVETLKADLNVKDRYGYTPLDYSLVYKMPFCFIYIT